jgi:hypothetical protein
MSAMLERISDPGPQPYRTRAQTLQGFEIRRTHMADMTNRAGWNEEDAYWRTNYRNRPYASSSGHDYDYYQPGYRYGYDAANRYPNRNWSEVETDLSRDWTKYEYRGNSTWEQMKAAVRDAWDRVTGNRPVGTR